MQLCTRAFGEDFVIEFDYQVTSPPYRGKSPDLNQPGEPPEPGEFLVFALHLARDTQKGLVYVDMPDWLSDMVQAYLEEDPDGAVYAAVAEEEGW